MCDVCVDAAQMCFPGISDKDLNTLLWGATSFPFGDPKHVAGSLCELRTIIDGLKERPGFPERWMPADQDVGLALMIADAETEMAMKHAGGNQ